MTLARLLRSRRFYRCRMPAGYAMAVAAAVLARPTGISLLLALVVVVAGLALRLWAAGHLQKNHALATGGPYAHTRNPLYLGTALITGGVAIASASPGVMALAALYFLVFYPYAMIEEGRFLAGLFGESYSSWARQVPAFFPRLRPAGPRASTFSWGRVQVNHEWKASLAYVAVLLLIAWRALDHV
jgi:hypothetical protein